MSKNIETEKKIIRKKIDYFLEIAKKEEKLGFIHLFKNQLKLLTSLENLDEENLNNILKSTEKQSDMNLRMLISIVIQEDANPK